MSHLDPPQPQIANLIAGQRLVLSLQLFAPLPDNITNGGNRVRRGEDRYDVLSRQFNLLPRRDANQVAGNPSAVQLLPGLVRQRGIPLSKLTPELDRAANAARLPDT